MIDLNLLKFSSVIKRKKKIAEAIEMIKTFLKDIPDLDSFKNSDELAEIVTNVVEALLNKKCKKYRIDKKSVCFEIFDELFKEQPLTAQEKELLGKRIEFLHEKGLIKGISSLKIVSRHVLEWLLRKLL